MQIFSVGFCHAMASCFLGASVSPSDLAFEESYHIRLLLKRYLHGFDERSGKEEFVHLDTNTLTLVLVTHCEVRTLRDMVDDPDNHLFRFFLRLVVLELGCLLSEIVVEDRD